MLKVQNKKDLEIKIESIPKHPNPKVELEQYSTPATIAADILWNAYNLGDIDNKNILDLGSGTGIFTIGSSLLNSKYSIGIDMDKQSVDLAIETAKSMEIENYKFLNEDLNSFKSTTSNKPQSNQPTLNNVTTKDLNEAIVKYTIGPIDTLIQNPPFGSQFKAKKGSDRTFIQIAMSSSPVIYSFHMANTESFLNNYFNDLGGKITHKFLYDFPIPKIYDFHTKDSKNVNVIVLRVENKNLN
ncbi:MAG: METTL5 family protein [Methanobrevibacter sp.]|jgi:putative methylase|nr:METTL5 family protein [Candidatus Methanovirga australis]